MSFETIAVNFYSLELRRNSKKKHSQVTLNGSSFGDGVK